MSKTLPITLILDPTLVLDPRQIQCSFLNRSSCATICSYLRRGRFGHLHRCKLRSRPFQQKLSFHNGERIDETACHSCLLGHRYSGCELTRCTPEAQLDPEPTGLCQPESAAAATSALERSRRLAQVLLRIKIELLFTLGAAEVIRLPFVVGSSGGVSRVYVHPAHEIFHCCCVRHCHLCLSS
jgi:hypothetical protein